jgi:hypothetical protein
MAREKMSTSAKFLILTCAILYFISLGLAYYKGKIDGMQAAVFQRYDRATSAVGEKYDAIKDAGMGVALKTIEAGTSAVTFWRKSPDEETTEVKKPGLISRVFHRDKTTTTDEPTSAAP